MVSGSQFVSLKSLVSWEEILHLKSLSMVQYTYDHLCTWEAEAKGSWFEASMGHIVRTCPHKQTYNKSIQQMQKHTTKRLPLVT